MTATPNHIHADMLDIVSPLRIAQRRAEQAKDSQLHRGAGLKNRDIGNIFSDQLFQDMVADLLDNRLKNGAFDDQGKYLCPEVTLDRFETATLITCLEEAIITAHAEAMPITGDRMKDLQHELKSGRDPMMLVLGPCPACWPKVDAKTTLSTTRR